MSVLQRKARGTGLSDPEADELGRLLAEASGRPYSNAADVGTETPKASRVDDSRLTLARRWFPMRTERRPLARTRSIELGQTSPPPEDAERQDETNGQARKRASAA
jgi:hypothetical protein